MSYVNNDLVTLGRYSPGGNFDRNYIIEVVNAIEAGLPHKEAHRRYGVGLRTLGNWMQKYGSEACQQKQQSYSLQLKRSVLRAIDQGMSVTQARITYNINSVSTVRAWVKQSKRENDELGAFNTPIVDTEKSTDPSSGDLQSANEALKKQLQEAQLKIAALNTLIDVAEEQLKINIRKKPGAKQS